MKKKLLGMLVAVMCIMLCACGSSEANNNSNTENTQNNSEVSTEKEEFSIVGEWKIVRSGESLHFNEDGTFESPYGTGLKYEVNLDSKIILLDGTGICNLPVGMVECNIIYENDTYKIKFPRTGVPNPDSNLAEPADTTSIVPIASYEKINEEYKKAYSEYQAALKAEEDAKKEQTPIECVYLLCQEGKEPRGYYFDGKGNYIKVTASGTSEGEYTIHESVDENDSSVTVYGISIIPKTTSGSAIAGTEVFYLAVDGTITCREWVTDTEKVKIPFTEVDESAFYSAFK